VRTETIDNFEFEFVNQLFIKNKKSLVRNLLGVAALTGCYV
jgi:hypothetical protein